MIFLQGASAPALPFSTLVQVHPSTPIDRECFQVMGGRFIGAVLISIMAVPVIFYQSIVDLTGK